MTICLCMIVKDESHIITDTLKNILEHIPISYWVISDTGSSDTTMDLIRTFFENAKIPGELIQRPWVDFSTNRNQVLDHAYKKTDYVLMFDADDAFVGTVVLPPVMTEDAYLFKFGQGITYTRPAMFSNLKKWKYIGVLHETLDVPSNEQRKASLVEGKYYINSGRTGSRNNNPRKYQDDAELLERALVVESNEILKTRYMYYCAQSYRDCREIDQSIRWYTACLDTTLNSNDKYVSTIELGRLHLEKNQFDLAQLYWCRSVQYDSERIEGIVLLMEKLFEQRNFILIHALYHRFKGYSRTQSYKPFYIEGLYDYMLEAYNSIAAPSVGDLASGYECAKKVIMYSKNKNNVDTCIKNLAGYKVQYDKDPSFKSYMEKKLLDSVNA